MADEANGQAPNVSDNQGQVPNTNTSTENENASQDDVKTFDAAYVKQLRDEAAKYRKQVRDLEAKVQQSTQSQMTEAERATQRLKDLEAANATLQQQLRTAAVER